MTVAEGAFDQARRDLETAPPQPPAPPELPKSLRFSRHQVIGVLLMLLIVGAAAVGFFGKSEATVSVGRDGLQLTVDHVSKIRHRMVGPLEVTVANSSSEAVTGVTVLIDRRYLEQFSRVVFTPSPTYLTDDLTVFELGDLAPGESIVVSGEVQSDGVGRHTGRVHALADDAEPLVTPISTFSFP